MTFLGHDQRDRPERELRHRGALRRRQVRPTRAEDREQLQGAHVRWPYFHFINE